ncbi:N-acetylmuramic acid 6-phosphate etherase [Niabella insulamsoli]|uniref:N-acetylmuramic acid 6-phosphate etherase n=1 Tax=Niabella insulamsoli TaxID=3144874 RepID=UPI0031FD4B47
MNQKVTEQPSHYNDLEKMSISELLASINKEDQTVPVAVEAALGQVEKLVDAIVDRMLSGGRLFYIGAGTSGRLGILDASEIPPTYGMPPGVVIGVIAGGNKAITTPVENAEDDEEQGWNDLKEHKVCEKDVVVGVAASGTTPYVKGALRHCQEHGIITGSISCNPDADISKVADHPVEVIVGPEFVTGSTRMKSGTAQKLVLNMISTSVMIQLGRVEGNRMVNMQLTNDKLIDRGTRMIMERTGMDDYEKAKKLLIEKGSVKLAIEAASN